MKESKVIHVGAIIRKELMQGKSSRGLNICDFSRSKPILVCMGGSQGSKRINDALRNNLSRLLHQFQIVHICGKGQIDHSYTHRGYKQFEYVDNDLADILTMADVVISRAGSNSIFEFLALKKPMLLIPLSQQASRGDQILNAQSFLTSGFCNVLLEEDMNDESFIKAVNELFDNRHQLIENMNKKENMNALQKVVTLIHSTTK